MHAVASSLADRRTSLMGDKDSPKYQADLEAATAYVPYIHWTAITLRGKLEEGSTAVVYNATVAVDGAAEPCVVKCMTCDKLRPKQLQAVSREASSHP